MRAELSALDDVRARCVVRHEDVRFESGASGIGSERSSGISSARDSELNRAEIFGHRYGNGHTARFEALRRVERFVFDPKIDIFSEFLGAQQGRSAFA